MPEKKFCDPGSCDCCQYIGEGDFLCDEHMEVVVSGWEPTEHYMMCAGKEKPRTSGKPGRGKRRRWRSRKKKAKGET